jgi:hypothetical protein
MKSTVMPPISRTKSLVPPSIVEPFLATVRLLIFQSLPSEILTESPGTGVAGSVRVQEPPVVSAII